MRIKIVKPSITDVEVLSGDSILDRAPEETSDFAGNELEFLDKSCRVSGVPKEVPKDIFLKMVFENRYLSVVRHTKMRWVWTMTKGNDPEHLRNKIGKEMTGRSTRFVDAGKDSGGVVEDDVYRIILPWHVLQQLRKIGYSSEDAERFLNNFRWAKSQDRISIDNWMFDFFESIHSGVSAYIRMVESGVPRESARYVLPFCMAEAIYTQTIDLNYIITFLGQRLCVRASPEMRCLASQMYFIVTERFPILRSIVGCNGFYYGVCPEDGVTGVRKGEQHKVYPPCPFAGTSSIQDYSKMKESDIFIPTKSQVRRDFEDKDKGVLYHTTVLDDFNMEKALKVMEGNFMRWANWEGEGR